MSPKNKKWLIAKIGLILLMLSISMGLLTGCELPFKTKAAEPEPVLIPVEVHFTGNSEPLVGYVKDLDVVRDGTVYQGGPSTCRLYNQNGEWIAVFNFARTEYVKTTLPGIAP
ncbi:MAG: hypothetical protein GX295_02450 [Syntrophomonadaceae bacterium]|nr:hypothetical protein [Syntrophomonadaceae bacterium]